jgi:hypothetical protein
VLRWPNAGDLGIRMGPARGEPQPAQVTSQLPTHERRLFHMINSIDRNHPRTTFPTPKPEYRRWYPDELPEDIDTNHVAPSDATVRHPAATPPRNPMATTPIAYA